MGEDVLVAAAPRWRWQFGRYRLAFDGRWRSWELDDGCRGVARCRTPWRAVIALRRHRREWEAARVTPPAAPRAGGTHMMITSGGRARCDQCTADATCTFRWPTSDRNEYACASHDPMQSTVAGARPVWYVTIPLGGFTTAYVGSAQHTYTVACAGHHPPGPGPAPPGDVRVIYPGTAGPQPGFAQ